MIMSIRDIDMESLRHVGEIVARAGVIVYPTDTIYGIGGNPLNPSAVEKVYRIKERDGKPMPVLVSDEAKAKELADVDDISLFLIREFWPGALTLILKAKGNLPLELTLGRGTIGLRKPNHGLALKIIEACGGALIGTSANLSGGIPATAVEELDSRIEEEVDLVIDGGRSHGGVPSTVLEVYPPVASPHHENGFRRLRVLRKGALQPEEIRKRLREGGFGGIEIEI